MTGENGAATTGASDEVSDELAAADEQADAGDAEQVQPERSVAADEPEAAVDESEPADGAETDAETDAEAAEEAAAAEPQEPLVETLDPSEVRAAIDAGITEMGGEDDLVPSVSELPPSELRGVLEAILLVSTKPLKLAQLEKLLPGSSPSYLSGFLEGLADRYTAERRGWNLRHLASGWQLLTRAEFHPWVRQLDRKELPNTLTRSAMETLAIVAYKQPVTRTEVEDVRGVQCGPMLRQLMDLKLVHVVGRKEGVLGNPLLYGTTDEFLERFGLGSPDDLPRSHELGD